MIYYFFMLRIYFALVYFVQAALSLTGIAETLYMSKTVGLSVAQITTLGGLVILPWTVKPLYGFLSDLLPLWKMRRKPYAILGSGMAILGWWWIALAPANYWYVLIGFVIQSLGLAITDVICDGLVLDNSTNENAGKLQSLCWGANAIGGIIGSLLAGFLASGLAYRQVFALAAFLPMLTLLLAWNIEDQKVEKKVLAKEMFGTYWQALKSKYIWVVMAFLYLWNISPTFGKPFYFYMKEHLLFSDPFIGILGSVGSLGSLFGAWIYGVWLDKYPYKKVLWWTVLAGAAFGLLTFLIKGQMSALVINFIQGAVFFIGFIPVLKLAARTCPACVGASMFALFASIINMGKSHSAFLGGWLYEPLGLWGLVWTAVLTSLLALPLIPFLQEEKELNVQ